MDFEERSFGFYKRKDNGKNKSNGFESQEKREKRSERRLKLEKTIDRNYQ